MSVISFERKFEKYLSKLNYLHKGGADTFIINDHEFLYNFNSLNIPVIDTSFITRPTELGSGTNGCVLLADYNDEKNSFKLVIKKSLSSDADNNYYEFLVGLCINKIKQYFPNFVFTFGYMTSGNESCSKHPYDPKRDTIYKHHYYSYDKAIKMENIGYGCFNNDQSGLLLQNVPSSIKLSDILKLGSIEEIDRHIFNILFQIYTTLHFMNSYYTHYDLSTMNTMYSVVPDNKYMKITYNISDDKIVTLYTKYIPVIIDYGRSHINFNDVIPNFTSLNIYNLMCSTVCNTADYDRERNCESEFGYISKKLYGRYTNGWQFYYINPVSSNRSHDLLFIKYIMEEVQFTKPELPILSRFDKYSNNTGWCASEKRESYSTFGTVKFGSPDAELSYSVKSPEEKTATPELKYDPLHPEIDKRYCKNKLQRDLDREMSKPAIINNVTDCYEWLCDEYNAHYNIFVPPIDQMYGELKIFPKNNLIDQCRDENKFQFIPFTIGSPKEMAAVHIATVSTPAGAGEAVVPVVVPAVPTPVVPTVPTPAVPTPAVPTPTVPTPVVPAQTL
jgi:hypothetical protein